MARSTEDDQQKTSAKSSSRSRKLNTSVTVHADRGPVTYEQGDEVPAEHASLIENPDVWDDGSDN